MGNHLPLRFPAHEVDALQDLILMLILIFRLNPVASGFGNGPDSEASRDHRLLTPVQLQCTHHRSSLITPSPGAISLTGRWCVISTRTHSMDSIARFTRQTPTNQPPLRSVQDLFFAIPRVPSRTSALLLSERYTFETSDPRQRPFDSRAYDGLIMWARPFSRLTSGTLL